MKEERIFLAHMRDALKAILDYAKCGREAFLRNQMAQDAMVRRFEILGEAAKHVTQTTRDRYPEIPFTGMAGLRDRAIHDYMGLNIERIWGMTEKQVPESLQKIEAALKELGEPET